jgi:hypothetical protein
MAPAGFAGPVGRAYEGGGTEAPPAAGSRRGLLRHGRDDERSETSVKSPVGAPLAKRRRPGALIRSNPFQRVGDLSG